MTVKSVSVVIGASLVFGAGRLSEAGTTSLSAVSEKTTQPRLSAAYGQLPLQFEANQGQTDKEVKFLSRSAGSSLFLTCSEAVLALTKASTHQANKLSHRAPGMREANPSTSEPAVVRMRMVGANPAARIEGVDRLPGVSNYFIGNQPEKWRTSIATYARVKYSQIYPGVDMIYYGNQRQLEYDYMLSPGADPGAIKLSFAGVQRIRVDAHGELVLRTRGGEVRQHKPTAYQVVEGRRQEIAARYVVRGKREVGFEVGEYDSGKALVIDPVLAYSTYLGGSGADEGLGIAVDAAGNVYMTGATASLNFPVAKALQPSRAGGLDAFVTKLNGDGSVLIYSTYLGGFGNDTGVGIALDPAGNAYVAGYTASRNFPTVNPVQPAYGGGSFDAFVAKLSSDGSALIYSTYLGGSGTEGSHFNQVGVGIAVDSSGNAYVRGDTTSQDFPTTAGAFHEGFGGGLSDAFVTKLSVDGSALVYSTYLGGGGDDYGLGIAVDAGGNAYTSGETTSQDFPTTAGAFQQSFGGGAKDAFVTKLSADGSALVYSTYLGGQFTDSSYAVSVDDAGNAYVTGQTTSPDFPVANALQPSLAGGSDAFVTKLSADGSALVYSTYLGGSLRELGVGIAVDASGSAYVTGWTESSDFPLANPIQPTHDSGNQTVFVTKLSVDGSALAYSTYLGGSGTDIGLGIEVDSSGSAYVTGWTRSTDFPLANPFQPAYGGGSNDAFVTKVAEQSP